MSLPPKLQQGFDTLRLDAEKVSAGVCALLPTNDDGQLSTAGQKTSEAASNAAALADMLIATNTVHSFQLGDGDRQVTNYGLICAGLECGCARRTHGAG